MSLTRHVLLGKPLNQTNCHTKEGRKRVWTLISQISLSYEMLFLFVVVGTGIKGVIDGARPCV